MARIAMWFNRTSIGSFIGIIWTVATILIMTGVGDTDDSVKEKMFSGQMMVMSYFLFKESKNPTKPGNEKDE